MNIDDKLINALETIQEVTEVEYIKEIIVLIYGNQLNRNKITEVLNKYNLTDYNQAKDEFIDLIIHYINIILNDGLIDETEYYNVIQLKRLFKIKQGDFYKFRKDEVEEIIMKQIHRIYSDNQIERYESIHKSNLQGIFDLSYDQLNEFVTPEVERALIQGADITNLDAFLKLPNFIHLSGYSPGRVISQEVKDLVWRRDGGKCVKCGSQTNLEFDHIIPFSKGGSSTYRNIQLLCENCNRSKLTNL